MAACFKPFFVSKGDVDVKFPVPCGSCPPCLQRRASFWSFRLLSELDRDPCASFITLTYDKPPMSANGFMTLDKRDFQLFMKRLRKNSPPGRICYYACGEYGKLRFRPHFHAIMYGADPEMILKSWGLGLIEVDSDVNFNNIQYVCKYITKGRVIPSFPSDDRVPEFALMSKHLGACYMTPEMIAYHKADLSRTYHVLDGGVKIPMSRYYRDRIYDEIERDFMFEMNQKSFTERFERDKAQWFLDHKNLPSWLSPDQAYHFYFGEGVKMQTELFFKSSAVARLDL